MEKRFKTPIKHISVEEAMNYISANEDFKNNFIHFYTLEPSNDIKYPADEGWEDVQYFTKRIKRSIPNSGEGKDIVYIMSNPSLQGMVKIGYTSKEIEVRRGILSKATGVPTPFKVEYIYRLQGRGMELEREIHSYLKEFRLNNEREFFEIGLKQAIEAVQKVGANFI
jgi:hypothetical protein